MDEDQPKTRREEDRLGFAPIAQHLARAIVDQPASKGFVFGIEGKWGSGKTTLINLIIQALKTYGTRAPEVVAFSPWLVGDREELLQTLFDELAIAAVKIDPITSDGSVVQDNKSWWRRWQSKHQNAHWKLMEKERAKKALGPKLRAFGAVAGKLGSLARTADALGVPVAGFAGDLLKQSGEAAQSLLEKESTSGRKAELVDALKLLSRRIVVFIDDLDRLEPREASEVLRLIRAVADFPNIIYVLSYDPAVVAQILSKAIQVEDGAAFLEKIVQVSFRVPQPEAFDLRRWFRDEVQKLFHPHLTGSFSSPSIESRLAGVIDSEGGQYLKTGRDVVRVLNALQLHALPVLTNIDIADMVWLQLVKIGNPEFYSWVELYLAELGAVASGKGVSVSCDERVRLAMQLDKFLSKDDGESSSLAYIELGQILPGLDIEHESGELHRKLFSNIDSNALAPFVAAKRIGSPQHYRYYFAFSLAAGALTDQEVELFFRSTISSPSRASSMLLALSRKSRPQGGTLADVLIDRLNASRAQLPAEAFPGIIHVLANTMDADELAVPGDFAQRFTWRSASRLLKNILTRANPEVRKTAHAVLFKEGHAIGWLTSILQEETFAHGLQESGQGRKSRSEWLLSEEELTAALNTMLDRYRSMLASELINVPDLLALLNIWRRGGHEEEVRQWVERHTAMDSELLSFLSRVRSWMNANGVQYYPLRRSELNEFLDVDRAVRRLDVIAADTAASQGQRAVASELRTAFRQGDDRHRIME